MLKQFFQSDKNLFIKEVASYFQNFLETDFRKRRLPKRSIKSTDTNGNQITINLLKYTSFRKKILTDFNIKDGDIVRVVGGMNDAELRISISNPPGWSDRFIDKY